jgi:ABC-type dipeptide/oligopeptide/nickel transport system permease component
MLKFILKRLAGGIVQTLVVVAAFFLLLRAMPADPAAQIAGSGGGEAAVERTRRLLGLAAPVLSQLWHYMKGIVQFKLGTSWNSGDSIINDIAQRAPVTITVVVLSFLVAMAIAIPLGRAAASKPNGALDRVALGYSLVSGAQPDFFWGLILIFLLTVKLHVFPVPTGLLSADITAPKSVTNFLLIDSLIGGDWSAFVNACWHLALPVITLAFVLTGPILRMTRESVLTVVNADYVLYGRAAGMSERALRKMMLANSIGPILTLVGILFAFSLGGAVLIEFVFSLNGIGLYALNSTLSLDYPAVQGTVLVLTVISLLLFILIDVVQALLDPRVRLGGN